MLLISQFGLSDPVFESDNGPDGHDRGPNEFDVFLHLFERRLNRE